MIVNAQAQSSEDLYSLTNPATTSSASVVSTTATSSSVSLPSVPSFVDGFMAGLNHFTLAWCIFYSLLFLLDFYYFYLYNSEDQIEREKLGEESLFRAAKIWLSYLVCLVSLAFYTVFPIFGILSILVYLAKLIWLDVPIILEMIWNLSNKFSWFVNLRELLKEKMKLPFIS